MIKITDEQRNKMKEIYNGLPEEKKHELEEKRYEIMHRYTKLNREAMEKTRESRPAGCMLDGDPAEVKELHKQMMEEIKVLQLSILDLE